MTAPRTSDDVHPRPGDESTVPDNWDEPPRRRPPYAKDSAGGRSGDDRWRTWDTSLDMDDDDEDEEPVWRRLGQDRRRGGIVIGLVLLLAAGAGIWFAWPDSSGGPNTPAAVRSSDGFAGGTGAPDDTGDVPGAPSASPTRVSLGVESPPPPPGAVVTPKPPRETPAPRRTALPPPPPAASSAPPPRTTSAPRTPKPTKKPAPEPTVKRPPQSGPTAPPPPPISSRPPPGTQPPQTGPTEPPPPPGR
ncbi:hypothetical protein [Sphaerisporangium sp. NPDC051011]|uniref:hypothetical protein n=1 Tax=Sphaerisporangium sp. NPDC051011 TaxID=3155792 RepID=UPI0033C9E880